MESIRENHRLRTVDLCYTAIFALLLAVCAWISVPGPVPFTLQTFAVFAALLLLGGRRGTMAIAVYLLMAAVGLPVCAGFRGGLGALLGPTGGYLLGFIFTALLYWSLTAWLGEKSWVRLSGCVLGLVVCYAFGTVWFLAVGKGNGMTLMGALAACVMPFVLPDLLKLGLAFLLSRKLGRFLH